MLILSRFLVVSPLQIYRAVREFERNADLGKRDSLSMHMVLYRDSMSVTAHHFFAINLSLVYGVRTKKSGFQLFQNSGVAFLFQLVGGICSYFIVLAQFKEAEEGEKD